MSSHRDAVRTARSVVVKIGTTALTTPSGVFDAGRLATLADAIEARMKAGSDVVIVSSGAIAAGIEPLRLTKRPADLATKQAAASVGQVALINSWNTAFARYNRTVGQVLLTAHDISMRVQHTNAQRTLDRLRALHAVAIVNENDTVATNEIRFGDNDRLSALVAHLVGADALVLLSDVDGLYDSDPRKGNAQFISEVGGPADLDGVVAGRGSHLGTGGMASKLSAALLASDAGVPVLLAAASDAATALVDASVGTVFAPRPERMSARRFWVRYAAESAGALTLDDGAVRAVVKQRRSLLPAGITAVSGRFTAATSSNCARPTRRWWPAAWSPTTRRNSRRCSAGRRRICPPKCAVPQCTPTISSPSSSDFGVISRAERGSITPKSRGELGDRRLDAVARCAAASTGSSSDGSTSTPWRAGRLLKALAHRRIGQHERGEHARGQLLTPQHAAVVHLRGYADVQRALFELFSGHRDKCCQHRGPDGVDQQPASGKPRQRELADLFVDRIGEQVADEIAGADVGDVGPIHVVAVELDGLPAERDAAEVVEQAHGRAHRSRARSPHRR